MTTIEPTPQAVALRELVKKSEGAILRLLEKYGAKNPRLFGSVARGDALAGSDIDLLVDMDLDGKDALWELSGLTEELRELLGVRVDVVCEKLLRRQIADFVKTDLVEL